MNTLKISLICLLFAGLFTSCKSNSTGPGGGGGGTPLTAAHPGSSFQFTMTQTDQYGNVLSTSHQTDSIVATGITWQGKSNVIEGVGWDDQGGSSTGYYSLLDNGDVAIYLGPLAPGIVTQWLTLPYSSGGPVSTTIEDQTVSAGGIAERTTEVATYSKGADTTMIVNGVRLSLLQVVGTYVITQYVNGVELQSNTMPPFRYYWAPSIGFQAATQYSTSDGFGGYVNGTGVLTGYTLR